MDMRVLAHMESSQEELLYWNNLIKRTRVISLKNKDRLVANYLGYGKLRYP